MGNSLREGRPTVKSAHKWGMTNAKTRPRWTVQKNNQEFSMVFSKKKTKKTYVHCHHLLQLLLKETNYYYQCDIISLCGVNIVITVTLKGCCCLIAGNIYHRYK